MGVQTALGYVHKTGNPVHRAMRALAATKPGAFFFSKTIQSIDGVVNKTTRGTTTATELLAGLPVVYVTTTGRKSGEPRRAPLIAVPIGDDLALLGTNFGGKRTPGWVYNLEADPSATISYRDATIEVHARLASDAQADAAFAEAAKVYPGYAKYRVRAQHRTIRVFMLGKR